jgi:hypothetical protein
MSKPSPARYRTTNWSSYTASLRKGGSLLIWLEKDMSWLAPHDGSPGRPTIFSDAAIQFCLTIKVLFKLPLRQTTGMVASLLKMAGWQRRLRRLYQRPDFCGLRALVFVRKEVPECLETPKHSGWSCDEARRILGVASCAMTFLHRNQLIKTLRAPHHRTRKTGNMITPEAMAAFLAKYETLGRLAKDENRQAKSVLAKLERLGIEPLPLPAPHSKIFRREDLQPYFA